jgi:arylsulfatase A-like enzyme
MTPRLNDLTSAMRATYYGLAVDHHLVDHRILAWQYDRTLIIVTSDHAEMLGEHYVWGKEICSTSLPPAAGDPRSQACGQWQPGQDD